MVLGVVRYIYNIICAFFIKSYFLFIFSRLILVRKILLSMVCVFLSSQSNTNNKAAMDASRYVQGLAATLILVMALFLHLKFQPYEEEEVNFVELLGLSVGFVSLYCGLWTFSFSNSDNSKVIVTYVVIICNAVWAFYTLRLLLKGKL